MMPASVSVTIPCHEGARFLARCLAGVFGQTVSPAEVIVVDDGSRRDPVAPAVATLPWPVRVITHDTNRGVSATRNTAIKAATSDYVAFLDCDDLWHPEKLAQQLALIDAAPDLDLIFSDFRQIDTEGRPAGWPGGLRQQLLERGAHLEPVSDVGYRFTASPRDILIRHTSFVHTSSALVRRTFFEKCGLFDEAFPTVEDLDLWIRMAQVGTFGLVDQILLDVEQRPESLGHQLLRASEYLVRLYQRLPSDYPDLDDEMSQVIRRRLLREHDSLAWEYRRQGRRTEAREHYRAAQAINPTWRRRVACWKSYLV